MFLDASLPDRFWSKCIPEPNSGCWLWTAYCDPRGYGRISIGGLVAQRAHRIAYLTLVGPITSGLELDHRCRNTGCVNPAHLEPVAHLINILRGDAPAAQNARRTHCRRGHELANNARVRRRSSGRTYRSCLACRRERHAERKAG